MPDDNEVRFKQIAVVAGGAGTGDGPTQMLFGLSEEGIVYRWVNRQHSWVQFPMKKAK